LLSAVPANNSPPINAPYTAFAPLTGKILRAMAILQQSKTLKRRECHHIGIDLSSQAHSAASTLYL
jgi:hypothetical protein